MRGKRWRFEMLVHSMSHELHSYAYRLCGDRFQAQDLVQETFLRAWKSLRGLRDESAARSWLYTILRREHARLYQRCRPEPGELPCVDLVAAPEFDTSAEAFALRSGIARLPDKYREPLLLQVIGGFSCTEIAQMLELTPDTVMARVSRARRKMREILATDGAERFITGSEL